MDDYENDGFIPDIDENNTNDLYEEGHEVDEYDNDSWTSEYDDDVHWRVDPETGDRTYDARSNSDAPQAEDFDTYEAYEIAMVDYRVDQKLAATGVQPSGPSPADIARQEAAFDQGISDGLADPSWEKKRELVAEVEQLHERAMQAQADGDMQLAFRLEMMKHETIRELERQPASPLRKQAEQANKQEVFQMWNSAVQNPGFIEAESKKVGAEKALADVRRVVREINKLNEDTTFAYIDGDSEFGDHPEIIKTDMLRTVKVDPEIAKDLRLSQKTMGERFHIYDELLRRNLVGPGAPDPAREAQAKREAEYRETDPEKMTQSEYEAWRATGRGGGKPSYAAGGDFGSSNQLPSGRKIKW